MGSRQEWSSMVLENIFGGVSQEDSVIELETVPSLVEGYEEFIGGSMKKGAPIWRYV